MSERNPLPMTQLFRIDMEWQPHRWTMVMDVSDTPSREEAEKIVEERLRNNPTMRYRVRKIFRRKKE